MRKHHGKDVKHMQKLQMLSGQAKLICLLFLMFLMSACGNQSTQVESTPSLPDRTPLRTEPLPTRISTTLPVATDTLAPTETTTIAPSNTAVVKPSPSSVLTPIAHISPGEKITITYIDMYDATTGWGLASVDDSRADHVLITQDGGLTWRDVTPPEPVPKEGSTYKKATAFFLDDQTAWVFYCHPGRIWRTSTGGIQWTESAPLSVSFIQIEFFYFADASHGWLMLHTSSGGGHAFIELYRSKDHGAHWERIIDYSSDNQSIHLCCRTGMVFYDLDWGLVTFDRTWGGTRLNWTHDGGLTWQESRLPQPEGYLEDLDDGEFHLLCGSHSTHLFPSQIVKVALECYKNIEQSGTISFLYTSEDGGENWQSALFPGGQLLFLDPELGWALGKDIYQTLDGGKTWTKMSSVSWDGQFSFVSQQIGWAVAKADNEAALVQTKDGGHSWILLEPMVVQ
jgi:photosystem II stability/assembly factor-like uncharacterized protein